MTLICTNMIKQDIGKIKFVEVIDIFGKRERYFTPWLNENLGYGERL